MLPADEELASLISHWILAVQKWIIPLLYTRLLESINIASSIFFSSRRYPEFSAVERTRFGVNYVAKCQ